MMYRRSVIFFPEKCFYVDQRLQLVNMWSVYCKICGKLIAYTKPSLLQRLKLKEKPWIVCMDCSKTEEGKQYLRDLDEIS